MKVLFSAALVLVALATVQGSKLQWELFKSEHGKTYSSHREHSRRYTIFRKNLDYINQHNKLYEAGESSFTLGVNEYADMTNEEFVAQFNGYSGESRSSNDLYVADDEDLPKSVDWRTKGYVTPIKNQKQCGSCWAFSAVGSMEGAHFKKTNKLVSLSEQNLVDCDKASHGCDGGFMDNGFQYVIDNKGIDTEASYPYTAQDGDCKFKKDSIGATFTSFKDIKKGSEKALTSAAAKEGPIAVAIDASHNSFQLYKSGVYDEPMCSSTQLDHGVLVVGYGVDNGKDYYIVKNSWGTTWGKDGYIWMSRNKDNQCGIATVASFPIA